METLDEVDRAIAEAVKTARQRRGEKYVKLMEAARGKVEGVARLDRQKDKLKAEKEKFVERLKTIDAHKDREIRLALETVRKAVEGNIAALDERIEKLDRETEELHRSNSGVNDLLARLKDRMDFLLERRSTARFPETLLPKTYLPECREPVRVAWDRIVAFAANRPPEKDAIYVNCVYNAVFAEIRIAELALGDPEIDEAFVVEKLREQVGAWAREAKASPEAAAEGFRPPGNDWVLYQSNQTVMAQGRKDQLDEEARAKADVPRTDHEVDPFYEKLIDSGFADWIRGKGILFYGANSTRSGMDDFARMVEKDLEARVFWYDIGESEGAVSRLVRCNGAVTLVVMWDKFAPTLRRQAVIRAAKGSDVPLLKVHSTNKEILLSELAKFAGKPIK